MEQAEDLGECDYNGCKDPATAEIAIVKELPFGTMRLIIHRCNRHIQQKRLDIPPE